MSQLKDTAHGADLIRSVLRAASFRNIANLNSRLILAQSPALPSSILQTELDLAKESLDKELAGQSEQEQALFLQKREEELRHRLGA